MIAPRKLTKSQILLVSWLRDAGMNSITEKTLAPYRVDIFLSEQEVGMDLGIEIDSNYHVSKKRDAKRDAYLLEHYGMPTLRFRTENIVESKRESIIQSIVGFLNNE